MPRCLKLLLSVSLITAFWTVTVRAADSLLPQHADLSQTSASGVSAGGYMAVQLHVAYSSMVKGVGVIAGGPYNCAESSSRRATHNCMRPDHSNPVPTVDHLVSLTDKVAASRDIDDPANLSNARVWLFSGTHDEIVDQSVMDALHKYYKHYVTRGDVYYKNDIDAGHGMIVDDHSAEACTSNADPYINDCSYDAAGALLKQIYGSLNKASSQPSGTFLEYDQKEFLDGDAYSHSMRDSGFAYIPESCQSRRCRVHVAFHGCRQEYGRVGDRFYTHAGFNKWADTNNLIVLYPQTIARFGWNWKTFWTFSYIWNPYGCWDWWGYDSPDYYKKSGAQMTAIKRMLERLALPRT